MKKATPTEYDVAIGGRAKHMREILCLPLQEVADTLGVTRQTLSNYESGRTPMRASVVRMLCETYGMPPAWLLGITNELFYKGNRCGRSLELRENSPSIPSPMKKEAE